MPRSLTASLGAILLGVMGWLAATGPDHETAVSGEAEFVALHAPDLVRLSSAHTEIIPLRITVAEGYHLQANPAAYPYLVPTRLDMEPAGAIEVGRPIYPAGNPYQLEGSPDTLLVYDGAFDVKLPLRAVAHARPGRYTLRGTLTYQRCDHRTCFRPVSEPVALTVYLTE